MCVSPKYIRKPNKFGQLRLYRCKCGKCPQCLRDDKREWEFRMLQEYKLTYKGAFVTLTYRDENLHYSKTRKPELYYVDVQKFIKRLRFMYDKVVPCSEKCSLTYWCCGEYGKNTARPHYHLIIFGLDKKYYYLIKKCWQLGFIYIGYNMSSKCISYVSKYVQKQGSIKRLSSLIGSDAWCEAHGVTPPFRHMSLGLGKSYLTKYTVRYHLGLSSLKSALSVPILIDNKYMFSSPKLNVFMFQNNNGDAITYPLPRYYRRKIFEDNFLNTYSYGTSQRLMFAEYFYNYTLFQLGVKSNIDFNLPDNTYFSSDFADYDNKTAEQQQIKSNRIALDLVHTIFDRTDFADLSQRELIESTPEYISQHRSVPIFI